MIMFSAALVAAIQLVSAGPTVAVGEPVWIVATIQHSEWCPAGNVRLDLVTGRFALTQRAPRNACVGSALKRPVTEGTLSRAQLVRVTDAFRQAQIQGLVRPDCREGGSPGPNGDVVVGNGGVALLVLTTGSGTAWAPNDKACWTQAAGALHATMDEIFPASPTR